VAQRLLCGLSMLTAAALALMLSQTPGLAAPPLVESTGLVHRNAEPETRRIHELTAAGGITAAAGWLVGIVGWFASISCRDVATGSWDIDIRCWSTSPWLMVPQVGLWIALVTGEAHGDWIAPTLALGIAQLGGLAALIIGNTIRIPVSEDSSIELEPGPAGVTGRF